MSKFLEIIIIAIATGFAAFVVRALLPKKYAILIREIIKFIISSLIKYWYLTIFLTGLILFLNYETKFTYLGTFSSYKFILIYIFFVSIIVGFIALTRDFIRKFKPINIAIFGCFSVKENEYLTIDIDSENLNENIERINNKIITKLSSYRNGIINTNNIIIPKFITILLGYKGISRYIKNSVVSQKHLASLHFIKNVSNQKISVIINFDSEIITNNTLLNKGVEVIQNLSSDPFLNNSMIIELSIKIYFLLFGQTLTDLLLNNNELDNVQSNLDDAEILISYIRNDTVNISEMNKRNVEIFLNFWTSYVERYRAIILIKEKQFIGATQHILRSIKSNPYFPYDNYNSLKQDYTKSYGVALLPFISETSKNLDLKFDDNASEKVKAELMKQISFIESNFSYEVLKEILHNDNSNKIVELVTSEFNNLDKNDPFLLLIQSEVLKYTKKGTEKINEIYVDRIDECINLLKKILFLDDNFSLIYTKIGILLVLKGIHFGNQQFINEGNKEYEKGMHFIIELGFNKIIPDS